MKKIFWIIVILVIILAGGIFYVSQVNNKSFFSTADEIFKGLNVIPTEAEKWEKIFPKQIGDYEREAIPSDAEARSECQNIQDHPDTKVAGIKGEVCLKQALVSVADAAASRLEPIALTTLCTIAGLIPITISDPLWRGLGGSIIAGLTFSGTIMLFFIPVVYYLIYNPYRKSKSRVTKN